MAEEKIVVIGNITLKIKYASPVIEELFNILRLFRNEWYKRDSRIKEVKDRLDLISNYTQLISYFNDVKLSEKNEVTLFKLYCFVNEWPTLSTELLPTKTLFFEETFTNHYNRFKLLKAQLDNALQEYNFVLSEATKKKFAELRQKQLNRRKFIYN
jgi:hypothetical protein